MLTEGHSPSNKFKSPIQSDIDININSDCIALQSEISRSLVSDKSFVLEGH